MQHDNIKWKVKPCFVSEKCWCRTIVTITGHEVVGGGRIDKEFAKYVVKLHNKSLRRAKVFLCQKGGKP